MVYSAEAKKYFKHKKVTRIVGVHYTEQKWRTFKTPPGDDSEGGYGPSGNHLWVYHPDDNWVSQWHNWSGCSSDIKELIQEKAMWCYAVPPHAPEITP